MQTLSADEVQRRAEDVFARRVAPTLIDTEPSRFVAIDVLSEDFEIDVDKRTAVTTLQTRRPDAQMWLRKTDHEAASRIGFWKNA